MYKGPLTVDIRLGEESCKKFSVRIEFTSMDKLRYLFTLELPILLPGFVNCELTIRHFVILIAWRWFYDRINIDFFRPVGIILSMNIWDKLNGTWNFIMYLRARFSNCWDDIHVLSGRKFGLLGVIWQVRTKCFEDKTDFAVFFESHLVGHKQSFLAKS